MKTFNQYVNEETMPFAQTDKGLIGIEDPAVRDNINTLIDGVTAKGFVTPYIGLERISKVLANFHIFLPKYTFAGGDEGVTAFEINQFGPKIGMTDDGQMVTKESSPYYLYFEYRADDDGMFGVFASVVTEDELDELMSDYEDEEEDDEEEINEEKMTDAQMKKREEIVKSMKKGFAGFEKRYGKDAKSVMYATATKQAMSEEEDAPFEGGKKKSTPNPESRTRQIAKMAAKGAKNKSMKKAKEGKQIDEVSAEKLSKYIDKVNKLDRKELKKRGNKPSVAANKIFAKYGKKNLAKVAATEETQLDEVSRGTLSRYISKAKGSDKRKKGVDMALLKKWGDKNYGLPEPKVKATNEENLDEVSKKTLSSYIKKASHDVATKSAATGRYGDRANRARDEFKKGDYKNFTQGKKDDATAEKFFKKSWKRREGIAKAADKLAKD